ncbi:MAG TPA: hypothetical protein VG323_21080, partial [Thermoanaerobaculia bacterium]|nr:hypothetical protein [Thermoanaerobaculia bacterium]
MKTFIALFFVSISVSAATPLAPVALTNAPYRQVPFDVASNGTDFVTIWSDERSSLDLSQEARPAALYASRLNADGSAAAPAGHRLAPLSYFAKLARNGAGYLVVWTDFAKTSAMPLDADGAPAAAPSVLANVGSPLGLASNGSSFLLVSTDNAGFHTTILTPDGKVAQTVPLAHDRQISSIWVLPNGSYQFAAFQVACTNVICASAAVLTTVSSSGAVTEEKLFDLPSSVIAAAYGNGHVLVANLSTSQTGRVVEYRLFDAGTATRLATVQVAADASFCSCGDGSISAGWDGSEFLIGYQWTPDLRAVRVTSDGVLLDGIAPIVLDPAGGTAPVFASNGATTVVVWGSGTLDSDVVSRSVRSFDDLAAAPVHLVSQSAALERRVQLAGGPNGPLAVWRARYPNPAIAGGV